ncbi:hypothetical protein MLD38_026210 [Melastoma candidum]|uniref:Uncharacterized protein n=1 Tax=Melastoma candidum TaxID=119954 RepID=A0ACB9P0R1_9MYRT|nr:hypothetical protein MLD38_026210 [Melastoma candidum]
MRRLVDDAIGAVKESVKYDHPRVLERHCEDDQWRICPLVDCFAWEERDFGSNARISSDWGSQNTHDFYLAIEVLIEALSDVVRKMAISLLSPLDAIRSFGVGFYLCLNMSGYQNGARVSIRSYSCNHLRWVYSSFGKNSQFICVMVSLILLWSESLYISHQIGNLSSSIRRFSGQLTGLAGSRSPQLSCHWLGGPDPDELRRQWGQLELGQSPWPAHNNMNDVPGVSFQLALHLAQMKRAGKFMMYDYGSSSANMVACGSSKPWI